MKSKKISVKNAVVIPFIIAILLSFITFVVVWKLDYNKLANEQGSKILSILNENTQQKIIRLLDEPRQISKIYNSGIDFLNYNETENLIEIGNYQLEFMKLIKEDSPQISVLFFADENQNAIGYRTDESGKYQLMVKDIRTNYDLMIFDGEDFNSEVLGTYEGYDPTQRPFYIPVKEKLESHWTDIYVNYDEVNDSTITISNPIIKDGEFRGITAVDIKLNNIHKFLSSMSSEKSVLYIIDENHHMVASSLDEAIFRNISEENEEAKIELLKAEDSNETLISESMKILNENDLKKNVFGMKINGEKYFLLLSEITEPSHLNWKTVSVVSEKELMAGVEERQSITIAIVIMVLFIGTTIAIVVLNKVIVPIKKSAYMASELASGNWEYNIKNTSISLLETDELLNSLNKMRDNMKNSFEQVSLSEKKYRELIESLDNMIYSLSPSGEILSVNRQFEIFFDRDRKNLIGLNIVEFMSDISTSNTIEKYFNIARNKKGKVAFQFRYRELDKEEMVLHIRFIPVFDDNNEIKMILASNSDMSELVHALENISSMKDEENEKLEELVLQRTKDLEVTMKELVNSEKLASLGSLVSGVAHEINTPLGVAVTTASYLEQINNENIILVKENKITKSGFVKFLDNISEGIKILNTNLYRASNLIQSFKMISVNQSIDVAEFFVVKEYIDATVISLKHEMKHNNHTANIHCNNELYIKSFSGLYSQIITNLVMNSVIHGFSDMKNGEINIYINETDNGIRIKYTDNGCGIEKENINKIFDPFYTSNRGNGGTGLGLNIVYNIITGKLDGTINCNSVVGEGVEFIIDLKLSQNNIKKVLGAK